MGRFLKNTQLESGSYSVRLPNGNGVIAPDYPVDGQFRYNNALGYAEIYYDSKWNRVGIVGRVPLVIDQFIGDGVQVSFNLTQPAVDPSDLMVFIGGVYQIPSVHYSLIGNDIIAFVDPPPNSNLPHNPNNIVVIHNLNITSAI